MAQSRLSRSPAKAGLILEIQWGKDRAGASEGGQAAYLLRWPLGLRERRRYGASVLAALRATITPNLVGPCVRFGLADDPGVEQIDPALLIVLAPLVRPFGGDDTAASFEKGGIRSERTNGDVTDTAE